MEEPRFLQSLEARTISEDLRTTSDDLRTNCDQNTRLGSESLVFEASVATLVTPDAESASDPLSGDPTGGEVLPFVPIVGGFRG